jgi:endonuclease/exonuclease/phosphatase family metal-dependent hydrolase
MSHLRLMAWNIAAGTRDDTRDQITCLQGLAAVINVWDPDILFVNEICRWNQFTLGGMDQVAWMAQNISLTNVIDTRTATLFGRGAKFVAIYSKTPLEYVETIVHSRNFDGSGYATLHAATTVLGKRHHLFSTRFDAWNVPANLRAHEDLRAAIARISAADPVLVGGDLNTGAAGDSSWPLAAAAVRVVDYQEFSAATGVRDVVRDPGWSANDLTVDHILIRGPYVVGFSEISDPPNNPSDHGYVAAELIRRPAGPSRCHDPLPAALLASIM